MELVERYPFLRKGDAFPLLHRFGGIPRVPADVLEPYWASYRRAPPLRDLDRPAYDLVFVLPESSRGWILEGICRDVGRCFPGSWTIHGGFTDLPPARAYFYAHQSFFPRCLRRNPALWRRANFVFFTHSRELDDLPEDELILALGCATRVLSMSSLQGDWLVSRGVPRRRVAVALAGADPQRFQPHDRGRGGVGLCSAFYARKNPELICALVRELPQRSFFLLGRGWEAYEGFDALRALPNLTYSEAPYAEYPEWYSGLDVFVSPSTLEGGPIPLLEAMMCNVVPVASRTGFAPDLVHHGRNGYLFDPSASAATVAGLVERAFAHRGDVSRSVRHLSWQRYALELAAMLRRHERITRWATPLRSAAVRLALLAAGGLRRVLRKPSLKRPRPELGAAARVARGGGERQAAPSLEGIGADRRARYAFAASLLDAPARVLDMACGVGYGARMLSEHANCLGVVAVDRSAEALAYAREHFAAPTIEHLLGDVETVSLEDAAFDLGVCFETVEHVEDASALLRRFRAALEPGGRLVLSTPNQDVLPFDPERFPFHLRHYTAVELEELISGSGFELEQSLHQRTKHEPELRPGWRGSFHIAVCRKPKE